MEPVDEVSPVAPTSRWRRYRPALAILGACILFGGGLGVGRLLDEENDDDDKAAQVATTDDGRDEGAADEPGAAAGAGGDVASGPDGGGAATSGAGRDSSGAPGAGPDSGSAPGTAAGPTSPSTSGGSGDGTPGAGSTSGSGGAPGQGTTTSAPKFEACDSSRLEGAFISSRSVDGGARQGRFELRNKGSRPCSLQGRPTLVLVKDGRLYPVPTEPLSDDEGRSVPMYGGSEPFSTTTVPGHAVFDARWTVDPGGKPCSQPLAPDEILIGLPDQRGALSVAPTPTDASGRFVICGGSVGVTPFTPS